VVGLDTPLRGYSTSMQRALRGCSTGMEGPLRGCSTSLQWQACPCRRRAPCSCRRAATMLIE
jgi:hypothetical protein